VFFLGKHLQLNLKFVAEHSIVEQEPCSGTPARGLSPNVVNNRKRFSDTNTLAYYKKPEFHKSGAKKGAQL
jgi:hypothetical protein